MIKRKIISDVDEHDVRKQLQKIIAYPSFAKSSRLTEFLIYVVEETLAGRSKRIKAYSIAISAFGLHESFNAQDDPIIRVNAARVRKQLEKYYSTLGKNDQVYIVIPKGTYVPKFSTRLDDKSNPKFSNDSKSKNLLNRVVAPRKNSGNNYEVIFRIVSILFFGIITGWFYTENQRLTIKVDQLSGTHIIEKNFNAHINGKEEDLLRRVQLSYERVYNFCVHFDKDEHIASMQSLGVGFIDITENER